MHRLDQTLHGCFLFGLGYFGFHRFGFGLCSCFVFHRLCFGLSGFLCRLGLLSRLVAPVGSCACWAGFLLRLGSVLA